MIVRTGVDLVEIERLNSVKPSIRERFFEESIHSGGTGRIGKSN